MNKPEFNWYMELDKAIKKEPSKKKYLDLKSRSESWTTCACGELCKALRRGIDEEPKDKQLRVLGYDLSSYISIKYWRSARIVLNQIESRTSQLLNEQRNG